ncbi:MAG: FecR domain-containing protein [Burkholderiaceae bacterium]
MRRAAAPGLIMRVVSYFARFASELLAGSVLTLCLNASCAAGVGNSTLPLVGKVVIGTASITYFARAGDTLMSIAGEFTNKVGNWQAIGKLNRIDRDSAIPIGTAILIPGELLGDIPAKATVVAMTGTIFASNADGLATRLTLGATVLEGAQVETGGNSFLTLALPDQSRISVPSNSRVQLTTLRTTRYIASPRTRILLLRGRVESRVAPLEVNRGRFEVYTPLSVAGVRGTHFRVGFTGGSTTARGIATETLQGKVAVATLFHVKAPDALLLSAGKGNITNAQQTGPAIDLLPPPRLATGNGNRFEFPAHRIDVLGVSGARGYHLQLATDSEALNLVAETRSPSTTLTIDGVPDGNYYAVLSAIDRFGLEGMASTQSITLRTDARARAVLSAPTVGGSDDKTVLLRWTSTPGASMRLQLARDIDFSFLLASRISTDGEARIARPPFGTYYARVELLDHAGQVRESSATQPLIVTDQWIINDGLPVAARQNRAPGG